MFFGVKQLERKGAKMNNEVGETSVAHVEPGGKSALVFEQQPRESDKAFAAFKTYLDLGPQRSLVATAAKLGKFRTSMEQLSKKYDWSARVKAYAVHMAAVEQTAREAVVRQQASDWGKRQEVLREEEWAMHGDCLRAGRAALEQFAEKERAANLSEIARILELASKLGRLASGLATDKTEVSGEDGGAIKVEFALALKKVYGQAAPPANGEEPAPAVIDVEARPVGPEKEVAGVGVSTN
jgi:hypothetical protein